MGNDPIPQLAELLEERGIKVLSLALQNINGLAAKLRRKGHTAARVVVVKCDAWSERKRFTLAHELGHMVIDPAPGMSDGKIEKAAHRFAGAFLIPADTLRAEMGSSRSSVSIGELVGLKHRFGVSIQAIAYRCRDLGILSQSAFVRLFKLFNRRDWRKPLFAEPGATSPKREEPKRFERLCYRAPFRRLDWGTESRGAAGDLGTRTWCQTGWRGSVEVGSPRFGTSVIINLDRGDLLDHLFGDHIRAYPSRRQFAVPREGLTRATINDISIHIRALRSRVGRAGRYGVRETGPYVRLWRSTPSKQLYLTPSKDRFSGGKTESIRRPAFIKAR